MNRTAIGAAMLAGATATTGHAQQDDYGAFLGTIVLEAPPAPTPAPGPGPAPDTTAEAETTGPVDTDGTAPDGVPDLADDTIRVTSDGIALSNPADLSELFVAEPTIAVGSSIPMSQKVYVNGIEENNLAITIDGARQNNKVFHHNTTTLIDPALLKATRIDPGVAPADAGPGALAGALAYETKDARDLLEDGATFGGRYKLEFDTAGATLANSLALYGATGGFDYLAFFKAANGGTREDGDGTTIIGSGTDLLSGLAKIAYTTESGSRVELSFERVRDDEARPYRANIGQIIGGRPVPLTRPYEMERTNISLTYTEEAPTGWWDPKIQLSYSVTELFIDEADLFTAQLIDGSTDSLSGVISNRFDLGWGSLNAGIDFYSDTADFGYVALGAPASNYETAEHLQNLGVFAQLRTELTDDVRLSFGMRADFQRFEGVDGSEQDASGVSGNISGEWDITDALTVSGGYSHVWGGIELAENFIHNPSWTYPAGGIDPVTADNWYAAAAYDFGALVIDGKVFSTRIDDARSATWGGGPGLTTDVSSKGFELGAGYTWSSGFARLGFASVDTELNGRSADSYTGNYLTMPMGDFLTLQVAHEFDNGLLIGGDVQYAFEYDDTYDETTGGPGPTLPDYTTVNVFAEYTPPRYDSLTLRAEVNNLFDETYANRATYGQEFPSVVPLNEPGRSLRLSAEFTF